MIEGRSVTADTTRRENCPGRDVARIRISGPPNALRVSVAGRLRVTDMGRLEHACGPALVAHQLTLELDLTRVTSLDAPARALIDRLDARGASVIMPAEPMPA